jgi:putative aminopeptidase FrvX
MTQQDSALLKTLCSIHAPSGNESNMTNFLLNYIDKESPNWKVKPEIYAGQGFQDNIVLVFGKPRTAIFAHIDSIGFTVRYGDQLVKIGGPVVSTGIRLQGEDSEGKVECTVKQGTEDHPGIFYEAERLIERGTDLVFVPDFRETDEHIQCCYMDNRLGVLNALKVCEDLENGAVVFSCYEEHGGGNAGYLGKFLYEKFNVSQALISDITWVTEGVHSGEGVAISYRDSGIPRRSYINRIIALADKSGIPFQLEVESAGGSDGNELQKTPIPFDWCFIGAPEEFVHSPEEKVHKKDIDAMFSLYSYLMRNL